MEEYNKFGFKPWQENCLVVICALGLLVKRVTILTVKYSVWFVKVIARICKRLFKKQKKATKPVKLAKKYQYQVY